MTLLLKGPLDAPGGLGRRVGLHSSAARTLQERKYVAPLSPLSLAFGLPMWGPSMRSAKLIALPIAGLLVAALYCNCARAEIRVQGPADDVRVEANGATVLEILAALGEHYPVRYRGTPESGGVTDTVEGPLRRVLVRVLKGNDFVIKGGGDGLEVIVLSRGTSAAAP